MAAFLLNREVVPENYIIRNYRRENGNPSIVAGTVVIVEIQKKRTFSSFDELWQIMNPGSSNEGGGQRGIFSQGLFIL